MSKTKTQKQLDALLQTLNEQFEQFSEEQNREYGKIAFLYSVDRMSPLEVALRMWFIYTNNVDEIYKKKFQSFVEKIRQ